jgi:hypothetical protein
MTADADGGGHSHSDSAPMDAEDYPGTAAGTSHGAGEAETEFVPPATEAAPGHAWSVEEPVTEALSRPWRSAWVIAGIGVLCAVVVAFAIFGIFALVRHDVPPTTPTHSASAPAPGPPQAARPDDDEFVAVAISPRAIGGLRPLGGFGTSGTQDKATQIALNECRATAGNDDCLAVNAGMFHGCVGYAIDSSERSWAGGSGVDADAARADALSRLGTPASSSFVQCSDPPGILRYGSPAVPPPTPSAELSIASLPGTDGLGWTAYPGARCDSGNKATVMGRTTLSVVVVCQIQPGNFYYRGVRLSDGAGIELANAVRSSDGFDVTNPVDGTRYQVRHTGISITSPDGQVHPEPMIEYWAS